MKVGISSQGSKPNAQRYRVVLALAKGPATSRQVSEATGLDFYCCSALLSLLFHRKLVKRKRISGRGRKFLYRL